MTTVATLDHQVFTRLRSLIAVCLIAFGASCSLSSAQILTKADLQREIAAYSAAAQNVNATTMSPLQAGRLWSHLGALYQDAGDYSHSQTAYENALRLLTMSPGSPSDLATAIDNAGTLYLEMGNTKEAEQAERKALRIRESEGLDSELAASWYHLASLYLREHDHKKSGAMARQAVDALLHTTHANPDDVIGAEIVLASSYCQSHRYAEAVAQFQTAFQTATATYGPDHYPTGLTMFLLGYAHWKNGDSNSARELMRRGYDVVGREIGWHPTYLCIMSEYARFLREEHERDEARTIEQEIRNRRSQLAADPAYSSKLQSIDITALY